MLAGGFHYLAGGLLSWREVFLYEFQRLRAMYQNPNSASGSFPSTTFYLPRYVPERSYLTLPYQKSRFSQRGFSLIFVGGFPQRGSTSTSTTTLPYFIHLTSPHLTSPSVSAKKRRLLFQPCLHIYIYIYIKNKNKIKMPRKHTPHPLLPSPPSTVQSSLLSMYSYISNAATSNSSAGYSK